MKQVLIFKNCNNGLSLSQPHYSHIYNFVLVRVITCESNIVNTGTWSDSSWVKKIDALNTN